MLQPQSDGLRTMPNIRSALDREKQQSQSQPQSQEEQQPGRPLNTYRSAMTAPYRTASGRGSYHSSASRGGRIGAAGSLRLDRECGTTGRPAVQVSDGYPSSRRQREEQQRAFDKEVADLVEAFWAWPNGARTPDDDEYRKPRMREYIMRGIHKKSVDGKWVYGRRKPGAAVQDSEFQGVADGSWMVIGGDDVMTRIKIGLGIDVRRDARKARRVRMARPEDMSERAKNDRLRWSTGGVRDRLDREGDGEREQRLVRSPEKDRKIRIVGLEDKGVRESVRSRRRERSRVRDRLPR